MQKATKRGWTVRYLEDCKKEKSACGHRYRLLSTGDGTHLYAHLVRIRDSEPHYHRRATELYYVVEGHGKMALGEDEVELRPGACLEIRPGIVHAARGDVLVLVVATPSISEDDTFFPPGPTRDAGARGSRRPAGRRRGVRR